MFDVESDMAFLGLLFFLLFVIVLVALMGLIAAGFNARQTQRSYWSVVWSGLRVIMVGVAVFCAVIFILITVFFIGFLVFN